MASSIVDAFLVYQFIKRLAMPFDRWPAFKAGVIDDEGKVLIKAKNRTPEQAETFQIYDVMVRNLKRLLAAVPGGSSMIVNVGAALALLKETRDLLSEEGPVNTMGASASNPNTGFIRGYDFVMTPLQRRKKAATCNTLMSLVDQERKRRGRR